MRRLYFYTAIHQKQANKMSLCTKDDLLVSLHRLITYLESIQEPVSMRLRVFLQVSVLLLLSVVDGLGDILD